MTADKLSLFRIGDSPASKQAESGKMSKKSTDRRLSNPRVRSVSMAAIACIILLICVPQMSDPKLDSQNSVVSKVAPFRPSTPAAASITDLTTNNVDALLQMAYRDIENLRLTSPPGTNALERLRAIAAIDPDNTSIQNGLQKIFSIYVELAKLADSENEQALKQVYLERAGTILFGDPGSNDQAVPTDSLQPGNTAENK